MGAKCVCTLQFVRYLSSISLQLTQNYNKLIFFFSTQNLGDFLYIHDFYSNKLYRNTFTKDPFFVIQERRGQGDFRSSQYTKKPIMRTNFNNMHSSNQSHYNNHYYRKTNNPYKITSEVSHLQTTVTLKDTVYNLHGICVQVT